MAGGLAKVVSLSRRLPILNHTQPRLSHTGSGCFGGVIGMKIRMLQSLRPLLADLMKGRGG